MRIEIRQGDIELVAFVLFTHDDYAIFERFAESNAKE